jgi:hypothetical protein
MTEHNEDAARAVVDARAALPRPWEVCGTIDYTDEQRVAMERLFEELEVTMIPIEDRGDEPWSRPW